MFGMGILSWLLVVPIIGALCIGALPGEGKATSNGARWIAFVTTIATFALSLEAWREFDPTIGGFQLLEQRVWLSQAISYKVGVDGVSLAFVLLTTFLMPFCIASSWAPIETRVKEYMIAFLMLEALMIGVFVALDLVLFYFFFEGWSDSDVPHHRRMGRSAARLRRVQILPLHFHRLRLDAARHYGDLFDGRNNRHSNAADDALPSGHAEVVVAGFLRVLCSEDTDVAGPYLVA